MRKPFPCAEVEEKIGYTFKNKDLLLTAFTHSTYANRYDVEDNERMEYLGDSVLQLVVTEWQYKECGGTEGELTRDRQKLVCEEALDEAVLRMDVQGYLIMFGGKANVGRKTVSSIFETLAAAVYLDGGYEAAKSFILDHGLVHAVAEVKNPKGALQEFLQQRGKEPPKYNSKKTGPDNEPMFYCEVTSEELRARGEGKSKKEAEQAAAARLLEKLERREDQHAAAKDKKRKK